MLEFDRLIAVPWYGLAALTGIAAAQPTALPYESPYAAYRPYRDEPLTPWRAANDEVARASALPAGDGHGAPAPTAERRTPPAGEAAAADRRHHH